jgi:hypothetical protein
MAMPEGQWRAGDPVDAAEKVMLERVASGQVFDGVDARPGQAAAGTVTVRAEVLRHLLTADDWPVDPKGVRLRHIRISGPLDLEAATVRCPLVLTDCHFDDPRPVAANFATIPLLRFRDCRLAGFSGDSLTVAGNLVLSASRFEGSVVLAGARIGGALQCSGTRIGADVKGNSLMCHGMNVRLSVHLNRKFAASGAIEMPRAEIGGEFICQDVHLGVNRTGMSLDAAGIRTGGALFLSDGFSTQGAVRLTGASIGGQLSCPGARLGADNGGNSLHCDGMRTGGSVNLDGGPAGGGFTSAGAVRLAGAEITGSLTCRGAQLGANGYGNALVADELRTSVAVLLEDGFAAAGAVRLAGAEIKGQLRFEGMQITGTDADGCSLACAGIRVGGPAHLTGGFSATGAIVLTGGEFGGTLRLSAAQLGSDLRQHSLVGDGIKVSRDMLLDEAGCTAGILLEGASIGGSLNCRGARLGVDRHQNSLVAGQLTAVGDVNLVNVIAAGAVIMPGARIGGLLTCRGARFAANTSGNALNCNGSKIVRAILLNKTPEGSPFIADGMVQLVSAETTGSLHCEGGRLTGPALRGSGLLADGMRIGGSAYLNDQFATAGSVSLRQASIGGSLNCGSATLGADAEQNALLADQVNVVGGVLLHQGFSTAGTISLQGAAIGGELRWEPAASVPGEVNLEGAHAQYLVDEWAAERHLGFWPAGKLRLAGFTYGGFAGYGQASVEQRLDWIRSQYDTQLHNAHLASSRGEKPGFTDGAPRGQAPPAASVPSRQGSTPPPFATQPYRQLSEVYRQAGQEDEARAVEIAMRRDMRKYGDLTLQRKALNWILDVTIRYGFNTGRALVGILALYVIVFLAFLAAQHQGSLIVASNLNNAELHPTAMRCVTGYPCFYPAGYAFDTVVPLINIHQTDFWQVNGNHAFGWAWVLGSWIATSLGWFLATLLVVGYTGLARQQYH